MSKRFRLFALAFLAALFGVALSSSLLEPRRSSMNDAVNETVPEAPLEAPESPLAASAVEANSEPPEAPPEPAPLIPEATPDVEPVFHQAPSYHQEQPVRRGFFRRGRR